MDRRSSNSAESLQIDYKCQRDRQTTHVHIAEPRGRITQIITAGTATQGLSSSAHTEEKACAALHTAKHRPVTDKGGLGICCHLWKRLMSPQGLIPAGLQLLLSRVRERASTASGLCSSGDAASYHALLGRRHPLPK
jgi:threonine aldolase